MQRGAFCHVSRPFWIGCCPFDCARSNAPGTQRSQGTTRWRAGARRTRCGRRRGRWAEDCLQYRRAGHERRSKGRVHAQLACICLLSRRQQQAFPASSRQSECAADFVSDRQFLLVLPAAGWTLPGSGAPTPEQLMAGREAACRQRRCERLDASCRGRGLWRVHHCRCALLHLTLSALLDHWHVIRNAMRAIMQS